MNSRNSHQKRVVVIGGGTGIYPVTTALKQLPVEISTIVAVSDSGGSTGRIRDEFGFQPVGDLRQSLAALAEGEGQDWIRKLLLYRFEKGDGLKGHNLGNLLLTALQDMTGSTTEALARAGQIFQLTGRVIPSANEVVDIEITYEDGSKQIGEDYLNTEHSLKKPVASISLTPNATATPSAIDAILQADLVIIGPGDYYASLIATLLPDGLAEALQKTSAKLLFISNLMTRHWQTDNMTAGDHVTGLEAVIGKKFDRILLNASPIPNSILEHYQKYQELPVVDDLAHDSRVIRAEVVSTHEVSTESTADQLQRSFLRHDSTKLVTVLSKELNLHS